MGAPELARGRRRLQTLRVWYLEEGIIVCAPSFARFAHGGVPPTLRRATLGPLRGGRPAWAECGRARPNEKPRRAAGLKLLY